MTRASREFFETIACNLKEIVALLGSTNRRTEELYSALYEELPDLEENINFNMQETEILLDYFIEAGKENGDQNKEGPGHGISAILSDVQANFEQIQKLLMEEEQLKELLEAFLGQNGNQGEIDFSRISELIGEIDRVLDDVRDISINSIIYASRFGEEGRPFSILAKEINSISNEVNEEFAGIKDRMDELEEWYREFQASVREIFSYRRQLSETFQTESRQQFETIMSSLDQMSIFLKDLIANVEESLDPVQDIMTLIQNQDILRQNLENLGDFLETLCDKNDPDLEHDPEGLLNLLAFEERVLELASDLTGNIDQQLADSLENIQFKYGELLSATRTLNEDTQQLNLFFSGRQFDQEGQIREAEFSAVRVSFQEIIDYIEGFFGLLKKFVERTDQLKKQGDAFAEKMVGMKEGIRTIRRKAKRLTKIKFLVRLEMSRLDGGDQGFAEDITKNIEEIFASTRETESKFESLNYQLNRNLSQFNDFLKKSASSVSRTFANIRESKQSMELTEGLIRDAVTGLSLSVDDLYTRIHNTNTQMNMKDEIRSDLMTLKGRLNTLLDEVREVRDEELLARGISEWEISDEELARLHEHFTSFLERETANRVLETDTETGTGGGELTLF